MKTSSEQLRISFACLVSVLLISGAIAAGEQGQWPKGVEGCGDTSKLFLNSTGRPLALSAKEIKERVIQRVAPEYPKACRCQGAVTVEVSVNTVGKVECARMLTGHPLLRASAVKPAKQWTFEPLVKDGEAVAFTGIVVIPIQL
jgi:TonB family protein